MSKILVMREERAGKIKAMRALLTVAETAARELTAEETAQYDQIAAEVAKLDQAIAREAALEQLEADARQPLPAVAAAIGRQNAPPGPEAKKEFETFAEYLHAVRFNANDQRLAGLYNEVQPRGEQRMDTGSTGGFAIPTQFRSTLLAVEGAPAVIRPRATVIPAGSPPDASITMPALDQTGATDNVYGGVVVEKTNEGGDKPETEFALRQVTLEPQEMAGYLEATDKLLRNWTAAASLIERLFRNAMFAAEDNEFLRGNGIGGPLGALNAGATYVVPRSTAGTIVFDDVVNMLARLLQRGGSPVWMASRSVMPHILRLRNLSGSPAVGDGALVYQPSLQPGIPDMLMGYPIIWHERSPSVGNEGDLLLADWSYYLIKDGSGPFVASSEHVKFRQNKTAFKIFWTVDGQPWLTAPFTDEGGCDVSPFVALGAAG